MFQTAFGHCSSIQTSKFDFNYHLLLVCDIIKHLRLFNLQIGETK